MPDLTVIIPTLNEAKSIRQTVSLVAGVMEHNNIAGTILVVDDDSHDGTKAILDDLATIFPLDYLIRENAHGLSNALYDAFSYARTDIIMTIDADGQHPPQKIPELYQAILDGNDIAIASRYVEGGSPGNLPRYRKFLSWGAMTLARFFFPEISDSGSGFFAFRKSVIKNAPIKPRGFRMLFEILGKGNWRLAKEIPYTLQSRSDGVSKLRGSIIVDYLKQLWGLFIYSLTTKTSHGHEEIIRLLTFGVVGLTGVMVNIGTIYYLTEFVGIWYMFSACVGVELSILTNFILNDNITFGKLSSRLHPLQRLALYHLVCAGGIIISLLTMYILTDMLDVWYIWGSLIGIVLAFAWNFSMSRGIAWRE
jgi:dolichol-phosphate mannosyltransferase